MSNGDHAAFMQWLRGPAGSELREAYGDTGSFTIAALVPSVNGFRLVRVLARIAFAAGLAAGRAGR